MIPTIAEIRDQILADIQSELSLSVPLPPRSVWGVLATAVAGALALVYRFADWTRRQIFTATADRESLILRGQEYGLTPKPAAAWRGEGYSNGTAGTMLLQGALYQKDSAVYRVRQDVQISGVTTVLVESLEPGSATNLEVGDILELVTPQTGVSKELEITQTTEVGEDAERTEDFRMRLLRRQRNIPQGGAIPDWVQWATEVPGIAEAFVERTAPGELSIYPITDSDDPESRIPTSAKLTEIENYVTDPQRSPIRAAAVTVTAPTELDFDVEISDLSPDTPILRDSIQSALEATFFERRPKQYDDEPDPRDVISAAKLSSIAVAAGADVLTVTLKRADGVQVPDFQLSVNELARLRSLTWI